MSIAFEAHAGFAQQFGGHAEVALGGGDIDVPQIRCQLRQQLLHVGAGAVPGDDSMHGSGVSDVVDTGLITSAGLAPNLCDFAQSAK